MKQTFNDATQYAYSRCKKLIVRFRSVFLYECDLFGYFPIVRYFEYRFLFRTIGKYHVLLRGICQKEISRFKRYSIDEEDQFPHCQYSTSRF